MPRTAILVAMLTAAVCPPGAGAVTLRPVSVDRFFVAPGEPATLQWTVASGTLQGPLDYTVRDYWGREVVSGRTKRSGPGRLDVPVKLAQGYYDVELPATGQRFGVVAIPAAAVPPDPFFAVDAAMSWLVRDDDLRDGLVKALRRSGIGMARERMTWRAVNPADGRYDWQTPARFEKLRRAYAASGVEVLEMFHDAPTWMGLVGKYPDNLVAASRSWQAVGRHWQDTWGALEAWNEPDIFFGANLPADQYVPLVKTMAWALDRARIKTPLVGGAVARCDLRFLDCAADNGLLECADIASFHTYGRAPQMEELIGKYRAWLAAHGRGPMPLWITECGRPWRRGPDRPPVEQDAQSAADVVMKAVEARAGGVARYFAFVYPFYEENQNNFGLMGRHGTPLRSMAAYARAASLLAGKHYIGDLACDDKTVRRARIFGDDRQAVAVIYTGQPDGKQTVRLGLPIVRLEGIDGRGLKSAPDGAVPAGDGLVYAWLDRGKLGARLGTDTAAMRLCNVARQKPLERPAPSPIVLRFQYDAKLLEATSEGYRIRTELPEKMPLRVRAFNLSDRPHSLVLAPKLLRGQAQAPAGALGAQKVNVAAGSWADVAWETDKRGVLTAGGRLGVTVTATGPTAGHVLPLHVDVSGPRR